MSVRLHLMDCITTLQVLSYVPLKRSLERSEARRALLRDCTTLLRTLAALHAHSGKLLAQVCSTSIAGSKLLGLCRKEVRDAVRMRKDERGTPSLELDIDPEAPVPSLLTLQAELQSAIVNANQPADRPCSSGGLEAAGRDNAGSPVQRGDHFADEPMVQRAATDAASQCSTRYTDHATMVQRLLFKGGSAERTQSHLQPALESDTQIRLRRSSSLLAQQRWTAARPELAALPCASRNADALVRQLYAAELLWIHSSAGAGVHLCEQICRHMRDGVTPPTHLFASLASLAVHAVHGDKVAASPDAPGHNSQQRAVALGCVSRWTRQPQAQLDQLERVVTVEDASERVHDVALLRRPEALVAAQERRFAAHNAAPLWQVGTTVRAAAGGRDRSSLGALLACPLVLGATWSSVLARCTTLHACNASACVFCLPTHKQVTAQVDNQSNAFRHTENSSMQAQV